MAEVSIIMPSYNSAEFIEASIKSVLEQTFNDWQLLIISNGSGDNSEEIIKSYAQDDERIILYSLTKNSGAAGARNYGIERVNTKYIAFLDSDDIWKPEFLKNMLAFIQEGDKSFVCSAYEVMNEAGDSILKLREVPEKVGYYDILKTNTIGCLTAIFNCEKLGKELMPFVGHEDCALWLKLLKKTEYCYGLNKPLALYRFRKNSLSGNKFKAATFQWSLYRKAAKLSIPKSIWYFVQYAVHGLLK